MKSKIKIKSNELYWSRMNKNHNFYELVCEDEIIGSLKWKKQFSPKAVAEFLKNEWTFRSIGFFKPKVVIKSNKKKDGNLAIFVPKSNGEGKLVFDKDNFFSWKPLDQSFEEFTMFNKGTNDPIFKIKKLKQKKPSEVFNFISKVEINENVEINVQTILLLFFGWYLFISFQNDSAIAAAKTGLIT